MVSPKRNPQKQGSSHPPLVRNRSSKRWYVSTVVRVGVGDRVGFGGGLVVVAVAVGWEVRAGAVGVDGGMVAETTAGTASTGDGGIGIEVSAFRHPLERNMSKESIFPISTRGLLENIVKNPLAIILTVALWSSRNRNPFSHVSCHPGLSYNASCITTWPFPISPSDKHVCIYFSNSVLGTLLPQKTCYWIR